MGLSKYRAKRKFDETPEPAGKQGANKDTLRFVVQKHAASRLHYDFRLELDGVLLSWAVPKGPSLNPADKRMAMAVEDHPLDYRDFEGIIPKGNYGAGTVMVWDEGTYHADGETDPVTSRKLLKAGLKKGDLKFVLHGQKLHGSFVLVKTKMSENSWLLIKHRDEYVDEVDVTAQDRSVKTGRSLEEIAKEAVEKSKVWQSNRRSNDGDPILRDVQPMLARLTDTAFDRPGWLFETKWDGYRAIAQVEKGNVKLYSRNGNSFVDDYPPVVDALGELRHDAVLDGEVVIEKSGKTSFQDLQNYKKTGRGNLRYKVFDLLWLDKHDLRNFPLRDRKTLLCKLLNGIDRLDYSDHTEEHGIKLFEQVVKKDWEGIIAKNADSNYQMGRRGDDWLKIKSIRRQEAVVGGFTAPRGSRKGLGALLLGVYDDAGKLHYIGHTGGGFTEKTLSDVHSRLKKLTRKTPPFIEAVKPNEPATWVKPELVVEVKFQEWTESGTMRQPIYVGWREDKPAKDVRREVPEEGLQELEQPSEKFEKVGKRQLKLTHLDKVYWPDDGYTKGDLIDYYRRIAPTILPYLKDRPESLHRHPNGIEASSFFQKDVQDQPPAWVKTQKIYSESNEKELNWLVCNDEATLVYMANLGCIELNPWHSRVKSLEKPDYLLIDIDAKTTTFQNVVKTVRVVKDVLDRLGIKGYPKTSGKTGLHVCVPLGAKYDYDQAKQFTELLMRLVHTELPDITSLERSPSKREGQIYLDFLQNRKGQTMAAPYSLRPVPGATVSTPLTWDEVNAELDPREFTMRTIFDRIDDIGDLWKPVLGKGIDLKKVLKKLE